MAYSASQVLSRDPEYGYNPTMADREFMTRTEVMMYLRISRGTLDKLQKRLEFPFAKVGKKVLFRKRDIDSWMESQMVRK